MAEVFFDSDLNTNGKIKLSSVPNATGTVVTYNSTSKELSTRTNAQIISDLGLEGGGLSTYVKKAGDTMTGALTLNNGVNTVINRDLSGVTAGSGFARDLFRLTGTNGIVDAMGWQGTVDASGNITAFGYGYLGGSAYNVKNAIRWNANQQVRIGSTGVPGGNYALEIDGNTLSRGGYDSQNGYFNTVAGELLIQRFGVNRIRTNTASLILSGDTSNGIVYIRPQGDAIATSEVQFRSNLTAVFPSTYNLYFGNQASEGGSIFHTNQANTTFGYGMWMNYNLQFDGTNFIQPRGTGVTSFAFTANQHKGFSFNVAPPNGTNGGIVSLTEVVRFGSTGTITTLNDGNSAQWNSAYNNGFTYKGLIAAGTDLNTVTGSGWYVQASNANATTALNYPVANLAGHLRVYGVNAVHLVQEYTTYSNNNDVYRRYFFNGTWYAWTKDWDTNDFTQVNVNSWNNIAANGATQQWVDQFYMNKSTQNIVKSTDWFITDDFSAGMEGKFKFTTGYPRVEWGTSSVTFTDEGAIDIVGYGFRQQTNQGINELWSTTSFKQVEFHNPQGTAPFTVDSSTLVTNLNADLLDGRHASDFALASQLNNYVPTSRTLTINGTTFDLSADRTWNIPVGSTYTAGAGLTLTGTQFSLPVTQTGVGNAVTSVTQTATGITVNKGDNFATTIDLGNYISKSPLQFRAVSDANNATGIDFFYLNGTNKPVGSTDGALLNMTYDNSLWNFQLYGDWRTGDLHVRTKTNGNWIPWQRFYHSGNLDVSMFVPVSRTITIDGVTKNLDANQSWTTNNTVTRLRGGGSFVSGDITINGGTNVTVSQSGQTITVAATDTNTTYSAGAGLTLTGTTFSIPVTVSGTGNGVASVENGIGGLFVTKADFATTSQLGNYVTLNTQQTLTASKTFNAGLVSNGIVSNGVSDMNQKWFLSYDNNGGEYGLYDYQQSDHLIAGSEGNYWVYGSEYSTLNGLIINKATKSVCIGGATDNNKLNVNGAVEASGLVSNTVPQSNNLAWTTDGSTFDLTAVSGKVTRQFILEADSSGFVPSFPNNVDLISIFYRAGGSGNNSKIFLPKHSRSGQEVTIMNNSDYSTIVCNQNTPLDILGIAPGDTLRLIFVLDGFPINQVIEDREGDGSWVMVNYLKGLRVFS